MIEATDIRVVEPLFWTDDNGTSPQSPKDLIVTVCHVRLACDLNAYWHSRFPKIDWSNVVRNKRYVCFVAHYDNLYYATAIWSSPIAANRMKNGHTRLELRRMAISDDAPKNTATRMLKEMRRWIHKNFDEITVLVSYQDTEAHHGTIYKADNWTAADDVSRLTVWDTSETRKRNKAQSTSPKLRWEYRLRDEPT